MGNHLLNGIKGSNLRTPQKDTSETSREAYWVLCMLQRNEPDFLNDKNSGPESPSDSKAAEMMYNQYSRILQWRTPHKRPHHASF